MHAYNTFGWHHILFYWPPTRASQVSLPLACVCFNDKKIKVHFENKAINLGAEGIEVKPFCAIYWEVWCDPWEMIFKSRLVKSPSNSLSHLALEYPAAICGSTISLRQLAVVISWENFSGENSSCFIHSAWLGNTPGHRGCGGDSAWPGEKTGKWNSVAW